MELRQLRSFLLLAAEGNFRRAAEKLHIVQPALSLQIQSLEEELGSALFLRTSRGVELTTAGKVFQVEAERTVQQADRARRAVQRAAHGKVGTVRIAFAGSAAVTGRLPLDLKQFHVRYPEVALELQELSPADQADAIEAGRLDLGYCHTHGSSYEFRLRTDVLATWPWLVAMSPDHPLAARDVIEAKALRTENFVVFGRGYDDVGQLLTLGRLLGREPEFTHQVGNALCVLSLVSAGVGLALAPEPMSRVNIPNLVFRPLQGDAEPTNLVLLSRSAEPQQAVVHYRELALALAKEQ